ncbi:HPP family protein [Labrys wisconsinensis]|uniref:CBS-domain-containing membrane protein n=1 Tax=Labrys wisconsinensis TaxID=425677 RepID=A0ABU0J8L9_9HYPH|nr:HPP family protein [Labrys wisconsinensis]MDQ0470621.1 CBS-domain-containing membrane protein [Labrys wisconsinensis]
MTSDEGAGSAARPFAARLGLAVSRRALANAALAGTGGFLAVTLLAATTQASGILLLIAPFGASSVLVFALPQSPLAQPRNVIGGHLVSTAVGLAAFALLGATPLAFGLGVGLAIAAMLLSGTTHPPAGADPIVVVLAGASWPFLFVPVLAGAAAIVALGIAFHRLATGHRYPVGPS